MLSRKVIEEGRLKVMKMKYEKPMVAVDLFELSQSIAGCDIKIDYMDSYCFLVDKDVPPEPQSMAAQGYFVDGICMNFVTAGTTYDGAFSGMCYHTNANGALVS